jgi:hypothetical protein
VTPPADESDLTNWIIFGVVGVVIFLVLRALIRAMK